MIILLTIAILLVFVVMLRFLEQIMKVIEFFVIILILVGIPCLLIYGAYIIAESIIK